MSPSASKWSRPENLALLDPIADFVLYLSDTARLRTLSERGMGTLFGALQLSKNSVDLSGDHATKQQKERVTDLTKWTDAAQSEIDSDFALLHGHSLMGVWGALEAMVDDVAVQWVRHSNAVEKGEAFSHIKVNIGPFMALSDDDKIIYLVNELKRSTASVLKPGLGQFEALLDAIGLGGNVDEGIRRALFHAQQLRNVVAHRGGKADKRFVDACPNLGYEIGDQVRISSRQFFDVIDSMQGYAITLAERVRTEFGMKSTGLKLPSGSGDSFRVLLDQTDDEIDAGGS